ncbi:MAG: SH3 domain-containing protein [Treponema sp.]|jgi:hypothetical protein|nr:SH3 domain-containing protein [Treponema sp.]
MYQQIFRRVFALILTAAACFFSVSCSRLGWGILLWSAEDPPVPSGTVLPVYIRSNIDRVWVVGIPETYRDGKKGMDKMEIPLSQFELVGGKGKARKRAEAFSPYALTYAETLQDGLPIRDNPDNSARRIYRLRTGEIIKVLGQVEGSPAISATGEPLPGEWYRVLTEDGNTGYCFSYRLKLFEHYGGPLTVVQTEQEEAEDPDLENLLTKIWSPESYGAMVNNRRLNLEELSRHWRFDPGQDTGIAHIYLPAIDQTFSYTAIRPGGSRSWFFEGSTLQMTLRSDTILAVQYTESGGALRTFLFVALPAEVEDLIIQETARREDLFHNIFTQGPAFTSNNYGTISFTETGEFGWTGFDILVPQVIPPAAAGSGRIAMDLFLAPSLQDRYNGAFTLRFHRPGGEAVPIRFMYSLDSQGFRLEYVPETSLEDRTVARRASSPMVLYFFKAEGPAALPPAGR